MHLEPHQPTHARMPLPDYHVSLIIIRDTANAHERAGGYSKATSPISARPDQSVPVELCVISTQSAEAESIAPAPAVAGRQQHLMECA